jgi:putative Mg2+ transporter-C (MgtC) family protein
VHFPSEAELAGRILLAGLLGGIIGVERELSGHPAGLRTHITLAIGAALFGVVSGYAFAGFDASRTVTNYQVDPTRVASQIVVGVGFLGGGAILKGDGKVRGLTTAASLWVTAAVGLACALGAYFLSVVSTVAVLGSLVLLRRPRQWLVRRLGRVGEAVVIRLRQGADVTAVVAELNAVPEVEINSMTIRERGGETLVQADLTAKAGSVLERLLAPLADRPDVADLEIS